MRLAPHCRDLGVSVTISGKEVKGVPLLASDCMMIESMRHIGPFLSVLHPRVKVNYMGEGQ